MIVDNTLDVKFRLNTTTIEKQFDFAQSQLLQKFQSAAKLAAPWLADKIRETFDAKGKRDNLPAWQITKNPTPLIKTGELRKSIVGFTRTDAQNKITIVVATDKMYAIFHDRGTKIHPKREFMILTESDLVTLGVIIDRQMAQMGQQPKPPAGY